MRSLRARARYAALIAIMHELIEPETARPRLRQWHDGDHAPFAAMGTDPRVMEYFI